MPATLSANKSIARTMPSPAPPITATTQRPNPPYPQQKTPAPQPHIQATHPASQSPCLQKIYPPPTTHRRQRGWTAASIGSQHPISQTRDSAKVLTSRTIPASAGPVPRSPPRSAPSDLKSQSPINPSPAKTHPYPDHTPASAGLDRSEHWIAAPYFPNARQRESPYLPNDPCERRPSPAEPPKTPPPIPINRSPAKPKPRSATR